MSVTIFLDSGPLGLVLHTNAQAAQPCNAWLIDCLAAGYRVCIPEIADYEVRRELLRMGNEVSIQRLNQLASTIQYEALTTDAMLQAAQFWADVRKKGFPTADRHALDADVILCAQAVLAVEPGAKLIVATTNPRHLVHFVDARPWDAISPGAA